MPDETWTAVFWCRKCGTARRSDVAPWCRHGDVQLPAARMVLTSPAMRAVLDEVEDARDGSVGPV